MTDFPTQLPSSHHEEEGELVKDTVKVLIKMFWFWFSSVAFVVCIGLTSLRFGERWKLYFSSFLMISNIWGFLLLCFVWIKIKRWQWDRVESWNFGATLVYKVVDFALLGLFNIAFSDKVLVETLHNTPLGLSLGLFLILALFWHIVFGLFRLPGLWAFPFAVRLVRPIRDFMKRVAESGVS